MKTRVFKGFFFQRIGECVVYVKDTTWHWGFDPEFWAHFCMDFFSIILHRIISNSKLRFYNALNNFEKKEFCFFFDKTKEIQGFLCHYQFKDYTAPFFEEWGIFIVPHLQLHVSLVFVVSFKSPPQSPFTTRKWYRGPSYGSSATTKN